MPTPLPTQAVFFDDFQVSEIPVPDTEAPVVSNVTALSASELEITFSEAVDEAFIHQSQFSVNNQIGNPAVVQLQENNMVMRLTFHNTFSNGAWYVVSVSGIKDRAGNEILPVELPFLFFEPVAASWKDVIITEIMADPSPPVELPEVEFVELYNRSSHPFNLKGWRFADDTRTAVLPDYLLKPNQYVILSGTTAATRLTAFGPVLGVSSFPTLNNAGDVLTLKDATGRTIDSLVYRDTWYQDPDKKDGGWTLEMIDVQNICWSQNNWAASTDPSGGTPGRTNAVQRANADTIGPKLLMTEALQVDKLRLVFDEPLQNVQPSVTQFTIHPFVEILTAALIKPSLTEIHLSVSPLAFKTRYTLQASSLYDCSGNPIESTHSQMAFLLPDTVKLPEVTLLTVVSNREVNLVFSKRVQAQTAEDVSHYVINHETRSPYRAVLAADERTVRLIFSKPFLNGEHMTLFIEGVKDLQGNAMIPSEKSFLFFQPFPVNPKDIVVTEIMADPSPPQLLPEAEYVELFNRSPHPVNLRGWTITDGSRTATFPTFILKSQRYVIVTTTTAAPAFQRYGDVLGLTNFPSLNNTGDAVVLRDDTQIIIDSVNYADTWYRNAEKKDGGWALEKIDPENLCSEKENWKASEDEQGGTPGKQNSVWAFKPDLIGPMLLRASVLSPDTIRLYFNEKLETTPPPVSSFEIHPFAAVQQVRFSSPGLTQLDLIVQPPLQKRTAYTIKVSRIFDCSGNTIQHHVNTAFFALPEPAEPGDIRINEILFNPRPTGTDFVEVVNSSEKFINLKNWKISNYENDEIKNARTIVADDFVMAPSTYLVFAENRNTIKGEYIHSQEEKIHEMRLPSFNNDKGSVAIVTAEGKVIDHFSYTEKMHAVFIKDPDGVSLERISLTEPTQNYYNWKSASQTAGFATPGYLNSAARPNSFAHTATVEVTPEAFDPIYGQPDYTTIRYTFEHAGFVANVKIFDAQGRLIKQIGQNVLLGTSGFLRWDGDRDDGSKARVGYYMLWMEVFNEEGLVQTIRKRIAIGTRFN